MQHYFDRNQNEVDAFEDHRNISPVCSFCPKELSIQAHEQFHNSIILLQLLIDRISQLGLEPLEPDSHVDRFRLKFFRILTELRHSTTEFEYVEISRELGSLTCEVKSFLEAKGLDCALSQLVI
jgi:hypothetical protein